MPERHAFLRLGVFLDISEIFAKFISLFAELVSELWLVIRSACLFSLLQSLCALIRIQCFADHVDVRNV